MLFRTAFVALSTLCIISGTLPSCSSNEEDELLNNDTTAISSLNSTEIEVPQELIQELVQSITSPVEMATLIKSAGGNFNSQYLTAVENIDALKDEKEQAVKMGICVADLGYINIYDKTMYTIVYLDAIKKLADGLMVGQFFDFTTLKRLTSNSENIDSLLYISTASFNDMSNYLHLQKRSELSLLMITGAWLEGLYIATQVSKLNPTPELNERIGEQKFNIENLAYAIDMYSHKPYFKDLSILFADIVKLYDEVIIEYDDVEPEMVVIDGQLVVIDNSKSTIKITNQQVLAITKSIELIRKSISN
jgi:hypothetical protein